jgi:hypothetical protein
MKLSLRVDLVDDNDPLAPGRPSLFSVQGFTCGSRAFVRRDVTKTTRWLVHLAPPGEPCGQLVNRFASPEEALAHLEAWVRVKEEKAQAKRQEA